MDKWSVRRTSCTTVHTHQDITPQVVVYNHTGEILWNNIYFNSVKEAKAHAELTSLPQT